MDILFPSLLLIAGFILLIKGADFLVDGVSALTQRFSVSGNWLNLFQLCIHQQVKKNSGWMASWHHRKVWDFK